MKFLPAPRRYLAAFVKGSAILLLAIESLSAQQTHLVLDDLHHDGWQLENASGLGNSGDGQLSLPAGSKLSRAFSGGPVIVQIGVEGDFVSSSDDWPVLEVGPAALALVRRDDRKLAVLVVDDGKAVELDVTNAKSLLLAYDPATGEVLAGEVDGLRHIAGKPSAETTPIIFSAGKSASWTPKPVEILVEQSGADGKDGANGKQEIAADSAANLNPVMRELQSQGAFYSSESFQAKCRRELAEAKFDGAAKFAPQVEVFTPPAVRKSRADEVRNVIVKSSGE